MALWELSVLPDNTTKQHSPLSYRTHAVYDSLGIGCSLASLCVYMRKNGFQNNQNILFLLYAFVYTVWASGNKEWGGPESKWNI